MISQRPAAEWIVALRAAGVPASPVVQPEELCDDEQAIANEVLLENSDPEVPMPLVINHPIRLAGVRGRGVSRPPDVGEDSDEVLSELGYSAGEIAVLRDRGVL